MPVFYPLQDSTSFVPVMPDTSSTPANPIRSKDTTGTKDTLKPVKKTILQKTDTLTKTGTVRKPVKETKPATDSVMVKDTVKKENQVIPEWNTPEGLFQNLYVRDTLKTASVVTEEGRLPGNFRIKNGFNGDWPFWLFTVVLFLFLWVRLFYRKYFNILFKSTVNYQASSKLYTEKNVLAKRVSMVLNFIYTIILGVFLYVLGLKMEAFDTKNTLNTFLILLNLVIIISVVKVVIHKITAFLFDISSIINEFLHNSYVINKTLGIILFPLTFAAFYSTDHVSGFFVFTGAVVCLLSVVIKFIRSGEIIIQHGILNFYSILYLCTLEFLPVLIGYRFLKTLI